MIAPDQLGQEHLHFLQSKVEADASAASHGERAICGFMAVLDLLCVPAVRVELLGVAPMIGIVVDVMYGSL